MAVPGSQPQTSPPYAAGLTPEGRAGVGAATPLEPAAPGPRAGVLSAAFVAVAAGVLALTLGSPVSTIVVGIVVLGVLHAILELRYVAGRFSGLALGLGQPFLRLLALSVAGIVLSRLLLGIVGRPAQILEIVLGYAIVAISIPRVLDRRHWLPAWGLTAIAAVASLAWPAHHFLVLVHVHLLAVVVFLWDWSSRLPSSRSRLVFRAVQVGWGVILPLLILMGAFDSWLGTGSTFVRSLVGDGTSLVAGIVPPGTVGTVAGTRLLAVFAFLQTMHLLVWVAFFPRNAPDAAADLEERVPWLTGARVWAIGFLAAALFAVVLVGNYSGGVLLHDALTIPHVYVEVPLLLALAGRGRRQPDTRALPEDAGSGEESEQKPSHNPFAHASGATYGQRTT